MLYAGYVGGFVGFADTASDIMTIMVHRIRVAMVLLFFIKNLSFVFWLLEYYFGYIVQNLPR